MARQLHSAPRGLQRALIVRLGHIGDVLLATPAAGAVGAISEERS
jgi:hypothetical protein